MKVIVIFIILIMSAGSTLDADSWIQKADFSGSGKLNAVAFAINGKGYVGTGNISGEATSSDIWEYDPSLNAWAQKADIPIGRRYAVGFAIGSKGYIGTGQTDTGYLADFWEYDAQLNLWNQRANLPGAPRIVAVGFSINGKGYIGTGAKPNSGLNDFYEYDPGSDSWNTKHKFPSKRYSAVGFVVGDYGYIGTGTDGYVNFKDFWKYDPIIDTWTPIADFEGESRNNSSAFSIGSFGYVGIGDNFFINDPFSDFWKYDPASDTWLQVSNFGGGGRTVAVSFVINDNGYVGLGESKDSIGNSLFETDLWEYDPDTLSTQSSFESEEIVAVNTYPNPTIESTIISFSLLKSSNVTFELMSLNGEKTQTLIDLFLSSGRHSITFRRKNLENGIYLLYIKCSNQCITKKIVLQ